MARLNILEPEVKVEKLEDLVLELSNTKPKNDEVSKRVKELVDTIKDLLIENNLTTYNSNGYTVTLQKRVTKGFDEVQLINYAHENGYNITKMVEVIDQEALESAVYNGLIPAEEIIKFETEKVVYSLVTKK